MAATVTADVPPRFEVVSVAGRDGRVAVEDAGKPVPMGRCTAATSSADGGLSAAARVAALLRW